MVKTKLTYQGAQHNKWYVEAHELDCRKNIGI
jgi:hypothetical protein